MNLPAATPPVVLSVRGLAKRFVLHQQGGATLHVLEDVSFDVAAGECVALVGPSGAGKSTVLKCIHGSYAADAGAILVRHGDASIDVATATPHEVLALRRDVIGYVSQFLRAVPRVPAERVVAEALDASADDPDAEARALAAARALLGRLAIDAALAHLPPATFSGGEQQRVNLARGFVKPRPLLLLDEPTASLDGANRAVVTRLITEACARGAAVVGIFHDDAVREAVATRSITLRAARTAEQQP